MKDALGHGSNGSGDGTLLDQLRARLSHVSVLKGGGIPVSTPMPAVVSDRPAAPVHPAMNGGSSAVRNFRSTIVKRDWSDAPVNLRPKGH